MIAMAEKARLERAQNVIVYAIDVGGRNHFGWAKGSLVDEMIVGSSVDECVCSIRSDAKLGIPLAIGFECPLFLPVPEQSMELCRGREGEESRSWSAQAGATVATLGFQQMAFILRGIKHRELIPCIDPQEWRRERFEVLFWEAFVSGPAHSAEHAHDAATAAAAFLERLNAAPLLTSDVSVRRPAEVLSLVGCALLWAGYSQSLKLLRDSAVVIKPRVPYAGPLSYTSSASCASSTSGVQ